MTKMGKATNRRAMLLCLLLSCSAWADEKVVFRCDFDGANSAGSGEGRLVAGYQGSQSLLIEQADRGSYSQQFTIPAERLDDRVATLRAMVKAENVSEPPKAWNSHRRKLKCDLAADGANADHRGLTVCDPLGRYDVLLAAISILSIAVVHKTITSLSWSHSSGRSANSSRMI
jgi:hypothetical protein